MAYRDGRLGGRLSAMASPTDFRAAGRVLSADAEGLVFQPKDTTYELRLMTDAAYSGPVNHRVECNIRVKARKVYTVPSGGLFITPIFGPPRIIQGRVRHLDERTLVVHAGTAIIVELPSEDSAYDLAEGGIAEGVMVNVTLLPGARIENIAAAAVRV